MSTREEEIQNPEELEQPPIPPTTEPVDGPIEDPKPARDPDAYIGILEATLRDQNKQIQELLNKKPEVNTVPADDPDEGRQQFYADPVGTIRKEIRETIQPLMDFVSSMKVSGKRDDLLKRFKANPKFADALSDPQIESVVLELTSRVPEENLNDETIQASIIQAYGAQRLGLLPNSPNNNSTPPTREESVNRQPAPAHMRPSPAPPNIPNQPNKRRPLTELEKRLARENRMSDDEYLDWLEESPSTVATSNIGKKAAS